MGDFYITLPARGSYKVPSNNLIPCNIILILFQFIKWFNHVIVMAAFLILIQLCKACITEHAIFCFLKFYLLLICESWCEIAFPSYLIMPARDVVRAAYDVLFSQNAG